MTCEWKGMITFLGTKDLQKTTKFYIDHLGFKLYKDQGKCHIYTVPGGGMIGFCSHIDVMASSKSPIITFITPDVDKMYHYLIEKGVEIEKKPEKNPYFPIYHFFLQDPNGYTVEIQKFLD
jgi:catechol 2,3-dioxygenase-like lactoylglutathione lyase family enzyme